MMAVGAARVSFAIISVLGPNGQYLVSKSVAVNGMVKLNRRSRKAR